MSDNLDEFFEAMLKELLDWRWGSAWEQTQVDAVEKKWRDKWAEVRKKRDDAPWRPER
jgi:hypothetical protein